jgi:hypothetical protein
VYASRSSFNAEPANTDGAQEQKMPPRIETPLAEGEYYPRMARPWKGDKEADTPGWNPEDREKAKGHAKASELANSEAQLHYLKEHLERRTIGSSMIARRISKKPPCYAPSKL